MTRRIAVVWVAGLMATLGNCDSRPRTESSTTAAVAPDTAYCSVAVTDSVTLSKADQCVFDAYRRRCGRQEGEEKEDSRCILRCMAEGEPNIAGGCWHVCRTLPEGVSACDSFGARPGA
ncbi:hypothetical protein [Longimicrobium sp.]|uniref:hypothetical protein n=1 Tax=Longimicrobium sp. TaxID=2029185 RepID=UPI003B3AF5F6